MEDSKHIFNVVFKMALRSPTDPYEMTNLYTFHVLPIYWSVVIIPAKGFIYGRTNMVADATEFISPSAVAAIATSACAIPTMIYSASVVLSGCTIFSSSPAINSTEIYTR